MHHDKLQRSLFFGANPRWSRRTLGVTLGAALALSNLAHASEGASDARGAKQPLDGATSTSHHRTELLRPGYQLHAEDVVEGVEPGDPIAAKLDPMPPQVKYKTPRWRLITIGSLLGSGLALSISGGTLLIIHDQPPRRRCRDYASELDCPFRYDTNTLGGVLLGVGFVNILAATVFTMYTNQYNRTQRQLQYLRVRVRPTATGMSIAF